MGSKHNYLSPSLKNINIINNIQNSVFLLYYHKTMRHKFKLYTKNNMASDFHQLICTTMKVVKQLDNLTIFKCKIEI